jgi:hypothetical protein
MGRGSTGLLPFCPLDATKTFAASYTIKDASTPPVCQQQPNGVGGLYVHALPQ